MSGTSPVLLIDVGSASVGVAFAEEGPQGRIVLSHTERTALKNVSGDHTPELEALVIDALKKTFSVMRADSPKPSAVHLFLAAPWYKALIRTIDLRSEKPLRITRGTVEKAVRDYRASHKNPDTRGVRRIESVVSQAYVNEYPTAIAGLLKGTTLEVELYESAADASFLEKLERAVADAFPRTPISFHSFLFSLFAVLRAFRSEDSFVLIDAGGEITDIAVVSRDSLRFEGSFPVGALSLIRAVAMRGSMADAASRLSLYVRNELSEEESAAFRKAYDGVSARWVAEYRDLLGKALTESPVSGTVFLAADAEVLPWFEHAIATAHMPFVQKPIPITPDFFQTHLALGAGSRYDAFLSSAALFILKVSQQLSIRIPADGA